MTSTLITKTYTTTGQKESIILPAQALNNCLISVKAEDGSTYSLETKIAPDAQRVKIPAYKDLTGDCVGRAPSDCVEIGINISVISGTVYLEISPK